MKKTNRWISILLVLVLCFSLVPTVLAESGNAQEAASVEAVVLADESGAGKIRLNTDGVVIDTITYDYDSNKITVDGNGVVSVKEGYTPIAGETVNVTVNYTYYDGDAVKYVENFDDPTAKPFSNTNYQINDGQSRTGSYAVTAFSQKGDPATAAVGPFSNVRVTAWYYDVFEDADKALEKGTCKFGFAATHSTSIPNTNQLGVFCEPTDEDDGTLTYYAYRTATSGDFADTNIPRTTGWHRLEWLVTDAGTVMSIDGQEVASVADRTQVANLTLCTNWCSQTVQNGMDLIRNRHYIDDVSIVSADATAASGTKTVSVKIGEGEAPVIAPQLLFSGSAASWTPGDDAERVWLSGADMAIDEATPFTLTGSESDAAHRYELVNGSLRLKEGKAAVDGETLTISTNVSYYTDDQLLWTDDLETENSLVLSSGATVPNLVYSDVMARNGLKSGTPLGVSNTGAKDGMWSPGIGSTGKLVFWYFDPCTEEELDKDALAAREDGFDQIKFGMAVNGYSNLLLGVAIPAAGDSGAFTKTDLAARLSYADTYTCRVAGYWYKTNIQRTPGWHEMAIDVTDAGATIQIDGVDVVLDGQTEPAVVTGVKSIDKVAVATNWYNKAETIEFIDGKHFIDDMYILKSDAGEAKTAPVSLTITVRTADDVADAAAVAAAKTAVEALELSVPMAQAATEAAAKAYVEAEVAKAIGENGVTAVVNKVAYQAAVAGSLTNQNGADGAYQFNVTLSKNAASATTSNGTLTITATKYVAKEFQLVFGEDGTGALSKGKPGRVYLENMDEYAIASVRYTTNNEHVSVSENGTLTVEAGYAPKDGEKVTVTAEVTYYDPDDVIFADSFEGEKQFTDDAGAVSVYAQSATNSLFGRHAATSTGSTTGYPKKALDEVTDVTVTAWYYDDNGHESQTKFGMAINGGTNCAMGVLYDGNIAPIVNDKTYDYFACRLNGCTYQSYSWGATDASRGEGWHQLQWIITENGLTMKIDGKIISTSEGVVVDGENPAVKIENHASTKSLNSLYIMEGWNNNATNRGAIQDRHFLDGVSVVKNGAKTETVTLTSAEIPVLGTQYQWTPDQITVDTTYPEELVLTVTPDLTELSQVSLDGKALDAKLWEGFYDNEGPKNAANYPAAWRLTIAPEALKNLEDGQHTLTLTMTSGQSVNIPFTAAANTHVAQTYYLSNNTGNDGNTGTSADQAWKSFDKLSEVTFGPGDIIYLDATSVWSGVQFRPNGSGKPGAPIVITKYNDGGDASKRPILNGDGTVADKQAHSYLAFEAWRKFYPSGTIELFNVENWEIRGLEITNYSATVDQGATGRNGIAVIHDYLETQGIETLPSGTKALEEAFYNAGKLQHIVIEDCYIHDVYGYHPANGATGAGSKMSGGINVYGPYDDLKIEKNIVMYCDVEGIRNDVLAWMGDTRTQFPCYMEDISISNNFIAGVPGDGVVISSAIEPRLANNYLTDAGYSYFATTKGASTTIKPMGNRQDPITMGETNFAGLWFIGTMDAVAEYNESVNNVWTCNDGEAFDADMFTWGTVFQYNYTYRNNGGFCLFMSGNQMDDGTIVRYNISVEDGEGIGTPNDGRKATFHYNKEPDAIYNNLFILGENVRGMFGGDSDTAYFYNNIVVKPSGDIGVFNLNTTSNSNANPTAMTSKTIISNNLFYPKEILENVTGNINKTNNITVDSLDEVFVDLDGFLAAQPVLALNGRSVLTGETVNTELGKGAGVAMSAVAGRSVSVPDGTGFDLTQFAGIKTVGNSPTIGAGIKVQLTIWPQTDRVHPLTKDFFQNDITNVTNPDIGPYQWSADEDHELPPTTYTVTFDSNGGSAVAAQTVKEGKTAAKPVDPTRDGYTFAGWYTADDVAYNFNTPVTANLTLTAKWTKNETPVTTYTVTFDSNGGSAVAAQTVEEGKTASKPADPTRDGYTFAGWYTTDDAEYDFTAAVTANITLTAKWTQNETPVTTYTVSFNSNGGSAVAAQTVEEGKTVAKPADPTRVGYTFAGWYTSDGAKYDFTTPVTADITLTAKWTTVITPPKPTEPADPVEPVQKATFVDVPMTNWAFDAVEYVAANGLFNGVDATHFNPSGEMTRAMLVTVLWRLEGKPAASADDGFADVADGQWYSEAVAWAAAEGIVYGVDANHFNPDGQVTREQIAAILWRLEGKPAVTGSLSTYPDGSQVSEYAREAMIWATQTGLFRGDAQGRLNPRASATRAEVAALVQRLETLR